MTVQWDGAGGGSSCGPVLVNGPRGGLEEWASLLGREEERMFIVLESRGNARP